MLHFNCFLENTLSFNITVMTFYFSIFCFIIELLLPYFLLNLTFNNHCNNETLKLLSIPSIEKII